MCVMLVLVRTAIRRERPGVHVHFAPAVRFGDDPGGSGPERGEQHCHEHRRHASVVDDVDAFEVSPDVLHVEKELAYRFAEAARGLLRVGVILMIVVVVVVVVVGVNGSSSSSTSQARILTFALT